MAIARMALAAPLAFIVPPATVATVPGCGWFGGGGGLPGLEVIAVDAPGDPGVCGVAVTAREGTYADSFRQVMIAPGSCAYVGAYERPGTYQVEVNQGGRIVTLENVQVVNGACSGVKTTKLTVTLPPPNP
jgi:hypothetical protein